MQITTWIALSITELELVAAYRREDASERGGDASLAVFALLGLGGLLRARARRPARCPD
ncbi:hypothetical protein DB30_07483 [Enhygromyxa salina]|uniref:Uncharacterized protein n=1 Tax=Enhygromyxa salina TaxID=215803 RepID=A0A0C2CW76_9BACT|nr:hypothetical protein [Enhygromyxa salina]KIG13880.1 hypothetical protein DB30_07483 [Enhygromyxa salina]